MRRTAALYVLMAATLAVAAHAEDEPSSQAALLKQGWSLFNARKYAEAGQVFERAVVVAEEAKDETTLVEALSMAGRACLATGDKARGRTILDRAGKLAQRKNPRAWSAYEAVRGRYQWKDEKRNEATTTFSALYDYCRKHELFDRAVDAAHMAAITGSPEEQLDWAKRGIEAAEAGKLDGWLGPLWNNLGVTHEDAGRFEEALEAYRKARHYHWKVGNEVSKLAADWAIGHTLRRLGRHEEAKRWLRPVLAWAERLRAEDAKQDEWVGHATRDLGLAALAQGRQKEAREFLNRAHAILAKHNMASWDKTGWKEIQDARKTLE